MGDSERSLIREKFEAPEASVRALPFWAWNSRLDREEIARQAREMKEQGMGGFFMHSREGLETEYMGPEWRQCILAGVAAAKELGMSAWLYDEDRWPSGTAGGLVTSGGDAYRCKGLTLEVCKAYDSKVWEEKELLAVYAAKVEGDELFALRRIGQDVEKLCENEVCLVVRLEISGPSEWFNGEAPPDNLNPECVKRFIALTHEKYFELCGEEFGRTVKGIFTDEPSLADNHTRFRPERSWIPWTEGFGEYFEERRGYDPLDIIPYLYFNGERSRKIRHDYWYMIALRFSESYAKTISQWCEAHELLMTGHFLQEDKMGLAVRVGGAIMPLYEYEHVPGIDMLREETEEFLTVKQCASVAHQLGRKQVLSETYGCTGWEFTFEGQRHIGDWQYVLGVNRRCQHLALYSLAGCRKRDYPPSLNYNTSWWEHAHVVEDYFARLGAVLEEGQPVQRILLLHPISTAWSRLGASPYGNPVRRYERDVPAVNEYGFEFNRLIQDMCLHHFDMDLGDEILLSKYARVEGKNLRVGEACYDTWVLPMVDTLLRPTFELLKAYTRAGGRLIVMEPVPCLLEGETDCELSAFWEECGCRKAGDKRELLELLEDAAVRTVSVRDIYGNEDTSCLVQQRRTGEDETLFLVNLDRSRSRRVTVALGAGDRVEEWNALNGEVKPVESLNRKGALTFPAVLGPADSKLYRIYTNPAVPQPECFAAGPAESGSVYAGPELPGGARVLCSLPVQAEIDCTMDNTLTLDRCRYRLEEEDWSEELPIWQAQRQVRERLCMRPVHVNGNVQRYKWAGQPHPSDGKRLELELCFFVEEQPEKPVSLALEHPENFDIFFNGNKLEQRLQGYLLDRDIKKTALSELEVGWNRVVLYCDYRNAMELEDCYLCGAFGVTRNRALTSLPKKLYAGDWTLQGFLHYAGSIQYQYEVDSSGWEAGKVYLELQAYEAVCVGVTVNGRRIEVPWKAASLLNITGFLRDGRNKLVIEVSGSPRNLFGPFHLSDRKRSVTNDQCFRTEGSGYTEEYQVVPYGLLQPPRLYGVK
ncbi:MAG: hypothetical protein K2J60_15830 [Acetatifactor sp.]|nr:hypothetical protein [Acetatifactor sp.]